LRLFSSFFTLKLSSSLVFASASLYFTCSSFFLPFRPTPYFIPQRRNSLTVKRSQSSSQNLLLSFPVSPPRTPFSFLALRFLPSPRSRCPASFHSLLRAALLYNVQHTVTIQSSITVSRFLRSAREPCDLFLRFSSPTSYLNCDPSDLSLIPFRFLRTKVSSYYESPLNLSVGITSRFSLTKRRVTFLFHLHPSF